MNLIILAAAAFDLTFIAPRANEMTLVESIKRASVECATDALAEPLIAWVEAEPTDVAGRALLDAQALDVMEHAGFGRDRVAHPVTFDAIRATLKVRTFVRVKFTANPEARACMEKWFRDNKFTVLSPDQQLPPELQN